MTVINVVTATVAVFVSDIKSTAIVLGCASRAAGGVVDEVCVVVEAIVDSELDDGVDIEADVDVDVEIELDIMSGGDVTVLFVVVDAEGANWVVLGLRNVVKTSVFDVAVEVIATDAAFAVVLPATHNGCAAMVSLLVTGLQPGRAASLPVICSLTTLGA